MQVELITKDDCPYCTEAKLHLRRNGVPFEIVATINDYAQRQALYDELGLVGAARSVPQIFVVEADGSRTRLGGYTDLINSDVVARCHAGIFNEEF